MEPRGGRRDRPRGSIRAVERILAWYRVTSSVGAVVALVVANAMPLLGVLFLGWSVWTILIVYWLENGIVGVVQRREDGACPGAVDHERCA